MTFTPSRTTILPLLLCTLLAACAIALLPAPAGAVRREIASGTTGPGGFPWRVHAERRSIAGVAALCLAVDHSWNPGGESFGNIAGNCVAGRVGNRFSLSAGRCDGVFAVLSRASAGDRTIRKLAFAVDPRARSLQLAFPGGERTTVRTHRTPRALRLPVRLAWLVDGGEAFPARAVARKGRTVVGSWRQGRSC